MTTYLDLIVLELERNPDAASRLAEALRPHLPIAPRLLTPDEAAGHLALKRRTLTRGSKAGRVAGAVRVGRGWRYRPDELSFVPPSSTPLPPPPLRRRAARSAATAAIANNQAGAPSPMGHPREIRRTP